MDAFFASVEQRDNPAMRGKPVVVGSDPKGGQGRGVVSTASYEARKYGIRSAMPISEAYRRCPFAFFVSHNFRHYQEASEAAYQVFYRFTDMVEALGIDEAFLDITSSYKVFGKTPAEACLRLKEEMRESIGLTCSVGLAPNKSAAKIASDLRKPNGFVEVPQGKVAEFLAPLPVGKLWGVGPRLQAALAEMGIRRIGTLALTPEERLTARFGEMGKELLALANGIDERDIEPPRTAKSVSNETTFEMDTTDEEKIQATLLYLSDKVATRMAREGVKGVNISLKVRLQGFETFTRAETLPEPVRFPEELFAVAQRLYAQFRREKPSKAVRLIGVRASALLPAEQPYSLFEKENKKKESLIRTVDAIRQRYGSDSIQRARAKKK